MTTEELIKALREKESRDNRSLLDEAADQLELAVKAIIALTEELMAARTTNQKSNDLLLDTINNQKAEIERLKNSPDIPCKVGDAVWLIRYYHHKKIPVRGIVGKMYFYNSDMKLMILVTGLGRGFWGERVFPSKEAAENFLNGGATNGSKQ